jgi:hypothetical protein
MQQPYPRQLELDPNTNPLPQSMSLAERLDPAIGEATSVIGAVVTELMRRSLRGGVMRIGDELTGYVGEKVDGAIADRTPVLEELASSVADKTARVAATEVATEEVRALEQRTTESGRQLTVQIESTREAAQQSTAAAARELTSRITETERRVVEDAHARLSEQARELTQRIEAGEQRVETTVRAEFSSQIQEMLQRSREGSERLKGRFAALEQSLSSLGKKHDQSHQDLARMLEQNQLELRSQIAGLLQANEALTARVVELEKPRGLRALFLRLFGRRRKPAATPEAAA